ncbi:MAG: hypothetical protein LBH76_03135 [Propionibacteriaceae bacterium]|jgi:hypothetical protein|nr:hypothetical protein [Propionibacteriaceae bacterium]
MSHPRKTRRRDADQLLKPLLGEDYVLYAVRCQPLKSAGWRQALFAVSLFLPDLPIFPPASVFAGTWYLAAHADHSTLARVRKAAIEETVAVPDWRPAWRTGFESVTVDGRRFQKFAKLRPRPGGRLS